MSVTETAIKRPSLIIVLFTALILGGLFSYTQLDYELLPDMSMPMLNITTTYPGAAPIDVEQTVTKSIEGVLSSINGINKITSLSMVVGLFPVALASGAGSEWKNSLAWVLMWGLVSSLILTVYLVPVVYAAVDKLKEKFNLT